MYFNNNFGFESGINVNNPSSTNYGLFAQTANSIPVSATTIEKTLIDGGVGSLSVPANGFQIGDSFSVTMGGHISSANNQGLTIKVKSGLVILGDTGVITMPTTTNKHWNLEIRFTIRSLGGIGVASIASYGQFTYSRNAANVFEGGDFSIVNNTTFSTIVPNTLDITAQWGSNNATNSIYSESFILYKIY